MHRQTKWILALIPLIAIALAFTLPISWVFVDCFQIQRATEISEALNSSKAEGSTIRRLFTKYGGRTSTRFSINQELFQEEGVCPGADEKYEMNTGPSYITNRIRYKLSRILPGRFQPWTFSSFVYFSGPQLKCSFQEITIFRPHGKVAEARLQVFYTGPESLYSREQKPEVIVQLVRGYLQVIAVKQWQEASHPNFRFDLDCLKSLRGCTHPCEVLPDGWRLFLENTAGRGGQARPEEVDTQCAQFADKTPHTH